MVRKNLEYLVAIRWIKKYFEFKYASARGPR